MRRSLACLGSILPLLAACANHVRLVEEERLERVPVLWTDRVVIELPEHGISEVRLEGRLGLERETTERLERVTTRHREAVPWSGWRELYELPLGLASLPGAIPAQGAGLLLGSWPPGPALRRFAGLSAAAANPAQNAELARSIERQALGSRTEVVGQEPRRTVEPLGDRTIQVSFEGGAPIVVRTGPDGVFSAHLLDVARASRVRALRSVRVRAPGERAERRAHLEAGLSRRLRRALDLIALIDRPTTSAESLASAVRRIDRLGFPEYALELEDEVRRRFADDPAYVAFFRRSLAAHGGRRAAVPASPD
jgi:hypothetical protein